VANSRILPIFHLDFFTLYREEELTREEIQEAVDNAHSLNTWKSAKGYEESAPRVFVKDIKAQRGHDYGWNYRVLVRPYLRDELDYSQLQAYERYVARMAQHIADTDGFGIRGVRVMIEHHISFSLQSSSIRST
jgi:hypothetical protein